MALPFLVSGGGGGGGAVTWDAIGAAAGNLTLANAGFSTTFNQTSAVTWTWANVTAATSSVSQSSPIHTLAGTYWTGSASAADSWTLQSVVANGTNGASTLTIAHSGSTGAAVVQVPSLGLLTTAQGLTATSGEVYVYTGTPATKTIGFGGGQSASVFNGVTIINNAQFGWTSGTTFAAPDTGLSRLAAGSIAIGSGTAGTTTGALSLTTLNVIASASAPTSAGTAGTVGQTIANGGNLYFCSVTGAAGSATWNKLTMTTV